MRVPFSCCTVCNAVGLPTPHPLCTVHRSLPEGLVPPAPRAWLSAHSLSAPEECSWFYVPCLHPSSAISSMLPLGCFLSSCVFRLVLHCTDRPFEQPLLSSSCWFYALGPLLRLAAALKTTLPLIPQLREHLARSHPHGNPGALYHAPVLTPVGRWPICIPAGVYFLPHTIAIPPCARILFQIIFFLGTPGGPVTCPHH